MLRALSYDVIVCYFFISAEAMLMPTWILYRLSVLSFSFCSIKATGLGNLRHLPLNVPLASPDMFVGDLSKKVKAVSKAAS